MYTFTDVMRNTLEVEEIPGGKVVFRSRCYSHRNQTATVIALPIDKMDDLLNFLFEIKYRGDMSQVPAILEVGEDEKYFVASGGDEPNRIFFSLQDAVNDGDLFIDSFDENGMIVKGYERGEDGRYTFYEQGKDDVFVKKMLNEDDL